MAPLERESGNLIDAGMRPLLSESSVGTRFARSTREGRPESDTRSMVETRFESSRKEEHVGDRNAQDFGESGHFHTYQLDNLPAFAAVEELRWKTLVGSDGEKIGTIETIERDDDTERVEFLQIGRGGFLGFGAERFLVPVTAIVEVDEKHVYIDRSLQQLDGVPAYDYERINDPEYCAGIRAWWCDPGATSEVARTESAEPI